MRAVTGGASLRSRSQPHSEKYPLVVVTWIDSQIELDQISVHDIAPPPTVVTCGWLVIDDPDFIAIAQERFDLHDDSSNDVRGAAAIPRFAVQSIVEVHAKVGVRDGGEA